MLDGAAERAPDAPAIRDDTGAWTYRQLAAYSHACAHWLRAQGVVRGDRVAVRALPRREVIALLYGSSRLGAAFVPVAVESRPYQLSALLADAEPAVTLTEADALSAAWEAVEAAPTEPLTDPKVTPDDPVLLPFTSGSTAQPKGVVCPHSAVTFAARAIARRLRYRPDDVVSCWLPLSFDYGLYQVFLSALATCELALADTSGHAGFLAKAREHGATVLPLTPALGVMLVRLARRATAVPPVRMFTNTGEDLPPSLAGQLREVFPDARVRLMFGITECKRISVAEDDEDLVRPGSLGRPLDGTRVRVLDEAGRPLPPGQVGEIEVSGPHVMAGYWKAPELSQGVFLTSADGERVLRTGDLGRLDAEGHLYFHGRRDQLFKVRGVRTSPVEIEAAAHQLPEVRAAAVLPPTAADGDAVLCVAGDTPDLTPEAVLSGLRELLGPTRVPRLCRVWPELPVTANGKVDRARLRALLTTQEAP